MSHYSKLHLIKLHHNFSIPGIGVDDISGSPAGSALTLRTVLPVQMVHTSKEGAMSTFVAVIVAMTDVLGVFFIAFPFPSPQQFGSTHIKMVSVRVKKDSV